MSSNKCVICEGQGKVGNYNGCENSCDACRKLFESSVKEMTKSNHTFLDGKNVTRHCFNNFGCQVKGNTPCNSCRFLKCIDNQMSPESSLKNAAKEVQENDPECLTKSLGDCINDIRATYESNLDILLSAAHEARVNSEIKPAMISGLSKSETAQDSTIKCVICEAPKEEVKIGNHYGCNNSCITCRKFFESSVKNMTKSSHKFLVGKNADRHCYNNFGCEVKGKRPCTSCRFLKCIDNQMNPELPIGSAAREVQRNDPEGQYRPLDDYTKVLRGTYDFNLAILLSAQHGTRVNSNIVPEMISENILIDPGYHPINGSYQQSNSDYCHGYMPSVHGTHNWNNQNNGNEYTDLTVPYDSSQFPVSNNSQQSANSHYGYVPHVVFNNPQQSTYSHVVFNNPLHNPLGNSSCMPAYLVNNAPLHNDGNTISHAGSYGNTGPNSHTHGTMGRVAQLLPPLQNPSTGTLNQEDAISHFGQATPVPVVQNYAYYTPGQSVNHAGPSTQIHAGTNEIEEKVQNLQLESIVPKDSEIKDTTHKTRSKRKSSTENVNETTKMIISADTYHRLPVTQYATELCKHLDQHGMKMDMCHACDYENDAPPDKRCECRRSLGKPETNPVTQKKTLLDTTKDGPHHFANWMCFFGLLFDFLAVEIPKKELFGKSICPAGRCYQSHDLMEHFVVESEKEGGKYVELKKNELRSGDYYFIWCRSKGQQYWQIYYGTDDHCEAGYGPYRGYDERRYFFNKEFDQQRKGQTSSGK